MADTRTLKLSLLADVQKFLAGMDKAEKGTKKFSSGIDKYGKAMAKSFAIAGVAAAGFAAKLGLDAVKAASDLNESVSKVGVIFGKSADEINKFAEGAASALGLSKQEALDSSATFATLGKAAGLTGKDLTAFSKKSVTLATDLGSFYNTKAEDAITAIGSALRGEAEPIRKYGVLISAASLDQAALNYENRTGQTLERDKKNQLTETSKVLARYQAIIDQTADAQGDFSRTSDGLANSQKILNADLANLKATMGEALIPFMKEVVKQAGYVAKAFAGKDAQGLSERARELAGTYDGQGGGAYNLGLALKNTADSFGNLFKSLNGTDAEGATSTLQNIADALNLVATGINNVAKAYRGAKKLGGRIVDFIDVSGLPTEGIFNPNSPNYVFDKSSSNAKNKSNSAPNVFLPNASKMGNQSITGGSTVININGVVDAASARKSIERVLQSQSRISGPISLTGAMS
jgi:hypothetical protein